MSDAKKHPAVPATN